MVLFTFIFHNFFLFLLSSSLCSSIFFRSFPACISMRCVYVFISFHFSHTQSVFCISLFLPSVLIRSSYSNHCACLLSFMFRELCKQNECCRNGGVSFSFDPKSRPKFQMTTWDHLCISDFVLFLLRFDFFILETKRRCNLNSSQTERY